jgi:hypothetical protein
MSLVGEITFEVAAKFKFNKIKETILNGKFENIPLEGNRKGAYINAPYGVTVVFLPNGNLVYSASNMIKLTDENFQIIKSIDVGGEGFLALSRRNQIYFCCFQESCILLLDFNLNRIKKVGGQQCRDWQYMFKLPGGLCCHENYVYLYDSTNRRIQIFTLDLDYVDTIKIEYHPQGIQISESTIGVFCLFY